MNDSLYKISHGDSFDPTPLTEDLKTFLHNTWTRGAEIIAFIGLLKFIAKNRYILTDRIDKKYFDSMYAIKPDLEDKLREWIEEDYEDAYIVTKTNDEDNGLFSILNKISINKLGVSNNIASKFMHIATRKIGSGSTTTSTCFYYLPTSNGDGYYILYFTFDGKSIKDCQILCFKGYDEKDEKSFYIRELEEWEDVDKKEYKK